MFKFRTMIANADAVGGLITRRDDPRVIPLGRWLRKTKLDELPELLNVILGDMSLVGPRPENLKSVSLYSGAQRRILETRPGLTSPATIKYRREADDLDASGDVENDYLPIMQDKLALELQYLDAGRSFVSDLQVLLSTISTLCRDALSGVRAR